MANIDNLNNEQLKKLENFINKVLDLEYLKKDSENNQYVYENFWDYRDLDPKLWANDVVNWIDDNHEHKISLNAGKSDINDGHFCADKNKFLTWPTEKVECDLYNSNLEYGFYDYLSDLTDKIITKAPQNTLNQLSTNPLNQQDLYLIINEYLQNKVYFDANLVETKDIKFNTNIVLAYGEEENFDMCSTHTMHELIHEEAGEKVDNCYLEDIQNNALSWLIYQQGYTVEDLLNGKDTPFLNSVCTELLEAYSGAINLVVSCNIDINTIENLIQEDNGAFNFGKEVNVGLVDVWNGAGGILEIELEKDLIIPNSMIHEIQIEEATNNQNYTVNEIYGLVNNYWKDIDVQYVKDYKPIDISEKVIKDISNYNKSISNRNLDTKTNIKDSIQPAKSTTKSTPSKDVR